MKITDSTLWRAFIGVAHHGNFAKASKALHVPVPQLSRKVSLLESHLGVRLFQRSTRVVTLTDEGSAILPRAKAILDELSEVESTFQDKTELSGIVRVTCVPYVAHKLLIPALREFQSLHPKVKVELQLTERVVNLVEDGIDMAIRIQTPTDTDLIYRKLAPNDLVVCASPEYLKRNPHKIKTPDDLAQHDLLFLKVIERCKFVGTNIDLKRFASRKRIDSDSGAFLTDLALNGFGVMVRAVWEVQREIEAGRLVLLLKNHPLETFGHIHAVIPSTRYLAPRVRAFYEFLIQDAKTWKRKV